jgi:hypothetical protein
MIFPIYSRCFEFIPLYLLYQINTAFVCNIAHRIRAQLVLRRAQRPGFDYRGGGDILPLHTVQSSPGKQPISSLVGVGGSLL